MPGTITAPLLRHHYCVTSEEIATYRMSKQRSQAAAEPVLRGFDGVVMTDGYGAYQALARAGPNLKLAHCWAHVRGRIVAEAVTAFHQAAAAFRSEGATLKAIATYKKVLKVDPTRYDVYRHLGDLNAERGLLSSAVQDCLTVGKYYLKERKGKEALEIYKKIVSQDPSNLDAQQRVAELCLQENLQDEATKVYLQLGRERSAQGRYDEAKDAYLAVLRIDPKNSEAVQFVESAATGSLPSQQVESSGRPVTPALKSTEPLDLLAEATRRMDQKQYAGAEAILNQLLTREPGNPQVCQLLARLHLLRGDIQVALGEYRFLAGAALRAQDYPLAEALITEFLAAEPNSVPLLELYAELP